MENVMMDLQMDVQNTPNPNAKKFVLNHIVKREGKISYRNPDECFGNMLARDLFSIAHVSQVHFFENVITITQDGEGDWDQIEWLAQAIIETRLPVHNPDFKEKPDEPKKTIALTPELQAIEDVLDRTIRPGLQGDGGDIEVLGLDGNKLMVRYQGACGSCPSSMGATLGAIESILKNEYNPDIEVIVV